MRPVSWDSEKEQFLQDKVANLILGNPVAVNGESELAQIVYVIELAELPNILFSSN